MLKYIEIPYWNASAKWALCWSPILNDASFLELYRLSNFIRRPWVFQHIAILLRSVSKHALWNAWFTESLRSRLQHCDPEPPPSKNKKRQGFGLDARICRYKCKTLHTGAVNKLGELKARENPVVQKVLNSWQLLHWLNVLRWYTKVYTDFGPPLWLVVKSFWLLTQGSRVRFPPLPDFSEKQWVWNGVHSASWTIGGATWKK
jgi:hypothetical protein